MARRGGRKTQINPAELVAYLDSRSHYSTEGYPRRLRKLLNGVAVSDTDARMIRRWRAGKIQGVAADSANALLQRYRLPKWQDTYTQGGQVTHATPQVHGGRRG